MNIITFDIEEWSVEKKLHGGRESRYRQFDEAFEIVLNELEKNSIKATFFCLGKLATEFPGVIRSISEHGHEIGCHSDEHRGEVSEQSDLRDGFSQKASGHQDQKYLQKRI